MQKLWNKANEAYDWAAKGMGVKKDTKNKKPGASKKSDYLN